MSEDKIIIRSGKMSWESFFILCVGALGYTVAIFHEPYESEAIDSFWFSFLLCVPVYLMLLNYWIAMGKTIIMDNEGCIVKFLWFKKIYMWADFKVVKITKWREIRYYYSKGAVFFTDETYFPANRHPEEHALFTLDHSLIYVKFPESRKRPQDILDFYVVDETLFREKMAEWGVELEEVHY